MGTTLAKRCLGRSERKRNSCPVLSALLRVCVYSFFVWKFQADNRCTYWHENIQVEFLVQGFHYVFLIMEKALLWCTTSRDITQCWLWQHPTEIGSLQRRLSWARYKEGLQICTTYNSKNSHQRFPSDSSQFLHMVTFSLFMIYNFPDQPSDSPKHIYNQNKHREIQTAEVTTACQDSLKNSVL